jgi:hypothetical protein
MAGLDYLCAAIIAMNTFQHSSRIAEIILKRNYFWWACMFNLRGRTNSCPSLLVRVVKTQRAEPSMNARLTALVKRVSELRATELKACHYIEKFHHR